MGVLFGDDTGTRLTAEPLAHARRSLPLPPNRRPRRVTNAGSRSPQLIMTDAFGTSVDPLGRFNMQSTVAKRSVVIGRHKTSVSLEDACWSSLREIAAARQTTKSDLLTEINERREAANLSSAVPLFVLQRYPGSSPLLSHMISLTREGCT